MPNVCIEPFMLHMSNKALTNWFHGQHHNWPRLMARPYQGSGHREREGGNQGLTKIKEEAKVLIEGELVHQSCSSQKLNLMLFWRDLHIKHKADQLQKQRIYITVKLNKEFCVLTPLIHTTDMQNPYDHKVNQHCHALTSYSMSATAAWNQNQMGPRLLISTQLEPSEVLFT